MPRSLETSVLPEPRRVSLSNLMRNRVWYLRLLAAALVSSSKYEACRGYLEQLRRESSLESFSALNECDKFLLRALGSDRTRGREFTTAIKISLKLFMGNAYAPFSPSEEEDS